MRNEAKIKVERCVLEIGDAMWVAVHKESKERVSLDTIVERKRLDDLCHSIKDDRFHEQKVLVTLSLT